ncbi:membrane protein insertase YidC [Candidatus Binatia bacterium]|nr:membrane protein insertase YidC [Candidatus Binatia bacterium]
MEKRAFLAAALALAILIGWQYLLAYLYPHAPGERGAGGIATPAAIAPTGMEAPRLPAAQAAPPAAVAQRVAVETDLYNAVFTSVGGRLESLRLKRYRTSVDPASAPQETVLAGQQGELPFGIELRGAEVLSDLGAAYTIEGGNLSLRGSETGALAFTWSTQGGVIRKQLTFKGDAYDFGLVVTATDIPPPFSELGVTWTKMAELPPQPGSSVIFDRTFYLTGRKVYEQQFSDLADGQIHSEETLGAPIGWVGYAGPHFLAGALPAGDVRPRLWLKLRDHTVEEMLLFPLTGGHVRAPFDIFVGPKDFAVLDTVGNNLSRAVDLGFFGFVALPLLKALEFSHRFTGNYGVDIILLTVVIKLLFTPLTNKSFKSMREMQKLQPQMMKIREKLKDKPEEMNKEIMELYRRHKVNPLGGCLPMLLQIPVFIGLYTALQNAVELRHAPFVLWINDLAAPDRLGSIQLPFVEHPGIPVLTLLMGVSMFVQQWMTPTAGDPTQQRVMMIMPVMFTVMFVNFPAGLVLYWLVNNVLTIAQQWYMTRAAT